MSRSRKKTPVCGLTKAESDKRSKVTAHRQERARVRTALDGERDIPDPKLFGDSWKSEKDGKQWLGDGYPELLRK